MKEKKKVACFIMAIIWLLLFQQYATVLAAVPIQQEQLYSKEETSCLVYDGIRIGIEFVVYQKEGKEYPAYCLNREREGVTTQGGYGVDIDQYLSNNDVWKTIIQGYPYHSYQELGCQTPMEAFAATKMAVYDAMYHYDWSKFQTIGEEGKRVLEAMKSIATKAKDSHVSKESPDLNIQEKHDWKVDPKDSNYVYKTYQVTSQAPMQRYTIKEKENKMIKIVDMDNQERTEFDQKEFFKVILPIQELIKQDTFTLEATAKVDTKPIFYGKAQIENKQNYALTASAYEEGNGEIIQTMPLNQTNLKIYKQDGETKQPIAHVSFQVLNENKEVVYSGLQTDENGICYIENMLPGIYYIQEVSMPNGYEKYEEEIQAQLEWNQSYTVTVTNFKKKEVPPEDIPPAYEQVAVLPRTGF